MIRIPADDFQTALYREHIQTQIQRWGIRTYHLTAADYLGDGLWRLVAMQRDEDAPTPIVVGELVEPAAEVGAIWIEDRDGRPVVAWALAGQRNEGSYGPVNPFGVRR